MSFPAVGRIESQEMVEFVIFVLSPINTSNKMFCILLLKQMKFGI